MLLTRDRDKHTEQEREHCDALHALPSMASWTVVESCDTNNPASKKINTCIFSQFQVIRDVPNTTAEIWSNTLLSEVIIRMRELFLPTNNAWNSFSTFLQCRGTSDLSSKRSVAQATQKLGTEKPWIIQTALWWACLAVNSGQSGVIILKCGKAVSSGWILRQTTLAPARATGVYQWR